MAEEKKTTASNPKGEKMVKIKLFKDNNKYKDDLFVGRNGETYLIQRGVEVEVPEGIAEIINNSLAMDELAAERIEKATK